MIVFGTHDGPVFWPVRRRPLFAAKHTVSLSAPCSPTMALPFGISIESADSRF
jgi:hypothetical protein